MTSASRIHETAHRLPDTSTKASYIHICTYVCIYSCLSLSLSLCVCVRVCVCTRTYLPTYILSLSLSHAHTPEPSRRFPSVSPVRETTRLQRQAWPWDPASQLSCTPLHPTKRCCAHTSTPRNLRSANVSKETSDVAKRDLLCPGPGTLIANASAGRAHLSGDVFLMCS